MKSIEILDCEPGVVPLSPINQFDRSLLHVWLLKEGLSVLTQLFFAVKQLNCSLCDNQRTYNVVYLFAENEGAYSNLNTTSTKHVSVQTSSGIKRAASGFGHFVFY